MKKLFRDYSIDHKDDFLGEINFSGDIWKKALKLLNESKRGPFLDIRNNYALFIKKKRKLELFEERKEVNLLTPLF